MNKTKSNSLPRLIKILLNLIYGLLIIVMVALLIMMIISPYLANRGLALGTVSVPVRIGSGDEPRMEITFLDSTRYAINQAVVEGAQGVLRFETDSPRLAAVAYGSKLLIAAGLTYIFFILRKIMGSILEGKPFAAENTGYIRRLGYTVLIVGFASGIIEGLAAWEVLRLLPSASPPLQASATFDPRLVLGTSLFIFLLAQIWGYGVELERDQELTV